MKTTIRNLMATAFIAASFQTHAQGLIYDQQSATNPQSLPELIFSTFKRYPLTQSFIPTLSAIGFVQFEFWDIAEQWQQRSDGLCESLDRFAEYKFGDITWFNDSGFYAQRIWICFCRGHQFLLFDCHCLNCRSNLLSSAGRLIW